MTSKYLEWFIVKDSSNTTQVHVFNNDGEYVLFSDSVDDYSIFDNDYGLLGIIHALYNGFREDPLTKDELKEDLGDKSDFLLNCSGNLSELTIKGAGITNESDACVILDNGMNFRIGMSGHENNI